MMRLSYKRRWRKSEMARTLVLYCVRAITLIAVWAVALKTYAVIRYGETIGTDLSDVLVFAGAAFGGELLLLAFKRVFAKKNEDVEQKGCNMITLYRPAGYDNPRAPEFTGRSIDTKPTNVENGASYIELDTGRVYRYDKENNLWIEGKEQRQ